MSVIKEAMKGIEVASARDKTFLMTKEYTFDTGPRGRCILNDNLTASSYFGRRI